MSFTYTLNVPNPPNLPSQDVQNMQTNTNSINSILSVDHISFGGEGNPAFSNLDGRHKKVSLINQAAPGVVAGIGGVLYGDNNYPQWQNAAGSFALVTGNPAIGATNGTTYLAGGIILQWGIQAGSSSASVPVLFATANIDFPNNCFFVDAIPIRASSSPGSDFSTVIVTGSVSTTGFTIGNIGAHTMAGWYWIALGN